MIAIREDPTSGHQKRQHGVALKLGGNIFDGQKATKLPKHTNTHIKKKNA